MLAAFINVPAGIGYPLLFLLVAAESAGAFVPGETSLIVAGALAAQGRLALPLVIAVAASAAILGDNTGYLIGRRGLRRLLDRPGRGAAVRRRLVERGEKFFARRGAAAVFFARWLPGLRVVTSWLAGAERMPWRRFLLWNALGGIGWAATIGPLAYLAGRSGSGSLGAIGFVGLGLAGLVYLVAHVRRHLTTRQKPPSDSTAARTISQLDPSIVQAGPTMTGRADCAMADASTARDANTCRMHGTKAEPLPDRHGRVRARLARLFPLLIERDAGRQPRPAYMRIPRGPSQPSAGASARSSARRPAPTRASRGRRTQPTDATKTGPPTRRERDETKAKIQTYTANAATRGLVIKWTNLTEREARRLVELTRTGDRSTRDWWPLVLRAAGIKR